MHHSVLCSRCSRKFDRGVSRVRRCVLFHFCNPCHRDHRPACEAIMDEVSGVTPAGSAGNESRSDGRRVRYRRNDLVAETPVSIHGKGKGYQTR